MQVWKGQAWLQTLLLGATLALVGCPDSNGTPDGGVSGGDAGPEGGGSTDGGDGDDAGPSDPGVTVDVSGVFSPGDVVKDGYSGATATVADDGTVTLPTPAEGVLLLEESEAEPAPFTWDNATVYFVMTDRFYNGDPSNDGSYGRRPDGMQEIGTFHGGDLRGLTEKLDHIESLGVNAIWITAPYEQIHGFVGGGTGDFPHYPYHGYYAKDFTKLDANMGTEADLAAFVDAAHERGIRVIFDVVMNHPGYASMAELAACVPSALSEGWEDWTPGEGEDWHSYHDLFIDYDDPNWVNWWGPQWIRAGLPGYPAPGADDISMSLSSLPDFRTNTTAAVGLPPCLAQKDDTNAVPLEDTSVRGYLIKWLTDWVREYGIDGFRADTAKHVEKEAWGELKAAASAALAAWKAENPGEAIDDLDFWMTGEVFPHGVVKDDYFTTGGFDSLLNFDFQDDALAALADTALLDDLYQTYADAVNADPDFNVLSYLSSHDTDLFFRMAGEDVEKQKKAGTALLLVPGGAQIFYGDETGRPFGPTSTGDTQQGTRSDMNWETYDDELLAHWQKLGQFRNRHVAIGAGSHERLDFEGGYAFARRYQADDGEDGEVEDKVVVVITDW